MKYFGGKIDGMKLSDFNLSDLTNLEKYEERLNVLGNIIENGDSFLTEYFATYYKANPNITEELSSEDAVCNMLNIFGTYLLSAKDIESERKVEYKFWKSMRDFRKSDEFKKQLNESAFSNGETDDTRNEVIDMFVDKKKKNQKIVKDAKVTAKDIKNNPLIAELNEAIKYVKSEVGENNIKKHLIKSLETVVGEKERSIINRVLNGYNSYMKKYVASMKEDQIIIKKSADRPIEFDNCLSDSGFPTDWEKVDIENRKVFVILLESLLQRDIMDEEGMGLVTYDLYNYLLNKVNLSEREREVVELFGNGMEQKKIADHLGITKSTMQVYVNRIHEKLVKTNYKVA